MEMAGKEKSDCMQQCNNDMKLAANLSYGNSLQMTPWER
jgi:hypothetical protein